MPALAPEETAVKIAAIVLAAGTSSRMGTSKPLLPLGSGSVIERVIRSASQAGVDDIVVVTGHRAEEVAAVLDGLGAAGVRHVYNAAYETGMFSSVLAGVGALREDVGAFFVLPVDCALVQPGVLRRLIESYRESACVLYPTCCGLRGHPPLLPGHHREALLQAGAGPRGRPGGEADEGGTGGPDNPAPNLRSFLQEQANTEAQVEVEDITILMDMDTPEDYQRLRRFAEIIDAADGSPATYGGLAADGSPATYGGLAADGSPATYGGLAPEDCFYLLSLLGAPDHLLRHSQAVTSVGVALAEALKEHVPALDVELVRSACLLHDMAKGAHRHAAVAQAMLENLGLHRLGSIVGAHMVIPAEKLDTPFPTEEQLVYLADKLVLEDKVGSLQERTAQALRSHAQDAAARQGVEARMRAAQIISDKIEAILGRPIVLETRIYLVRHAQPAVSEGQFIGQSNPPLSPVGMTQARLLAKRLKTVRFDAAYSSDLERCLATARIIAGDTGLEIQEEPQFREIDLGLWDGLTIEEIKSRYPAEFAARERDIAGFRFPGGESFRDLQRRVAPPFCRIMDSGAANVLVVAHKGVNRVLLTHLLGVPLDELFSVPQEYAAVNIIKVLNLLPDGSRQVSVEMAR